MTLKELFFNVVAAVIIGGIGIWACRNVYNLFMN
jgi:hypothetical protein